MDKRELVTQLKSLAADATSSTDTSVRLSAGALLGLAGALLAGEYFVLNLNEAVTKAVRQNLEILIEIKKGQGL